MSVFKEAKGKSIHLNVQSFTHAPAYLVLVTGLCAVTFGIT